MEFCTIFKTDVQCLQKAQMAGLSTGDIPMNDMFASPGGIPSSLAVNPLSMNPDPTVAERDHQPYNNSMGLPSSNMASQQLPYSTAPMPWGLDPYGSASNARAAMDFTKQSNWIQQVIEKLRDLLYILTPDGKLLYVSPSCKALTGYESDQVVGNNINDFMHADDKEIFESELKDSLDTGNSFQFHYRFKKLDATYLIFEAHGHPHPPKEKMSSEAAKGTGDPPVFIMTSRPYLSKNGQLLDSFLEHKMEYEQLTRKIADLKREEEEEYEADHRWLQKQGISLNTTRDNSSTRDDNLKPNPEVPTELQALMLSAAKPGAPAAMGTKQNSEGITAKLGSDCTVEKGSRFDNSFYHDGIEFMTGLRYQGGERSHGISTADPSAALIQSDTSITLPNQREHRNGSIGDKKKKQKATEEYVCTDCGTLTSPEWRKGPNGPKTLCNACGCESLILQSITMGWKFFVHGHCTIRLNFPADLISSMKQCAGRRKKKGVWSHCRLTTSMCP